MTLWPGTPLPPVPVQRFPLRVSKDGALDWRWNSPLEPKALPEEWVLRQLLDADLEDDAAVVALLEECGAIWRPYYEWTQPHQTLLRHQLAMDQQPPRDFLTPYWWESRRDGTLEDARWWLKTARALAGVWRRASLNEDPADAWPVEGFQPHSGDVSWMSWAHFTTALNIGLRPFSAHVEHVARGPGFPVEIGIPQIDLFSAAALQVFNLVVEEPTARRCENETCGRVFIRQIGGIEYRQHYRTTGLRFCSASCARAQASRQYRRRKAGKEPQL